MVQYETQLRGQDTVSGQEGRAYVINPVTNERKLIFELKSIEAKMEKQKEDIRTVGRAVTQKKTTGWTGTGTMTLFYVTSYFRELQEIYMSGGADLYFTLYIENTDPTSESTNPDGIGQAVTLTGCNIDGMVLAKIDTENSVLDEEMAFTFTGFKLDKAFTPIASGLV